MSPRTATALLVAASFALPSRAAAKPSPNPKAAAAAKRAVAAPPASDAVAGVYRVQGTAHVSARPIVDSEVEARADATLERGLRPREVRALLASQGHRCELVATLEGDGALAFAQGQRCVVAVDSPEARGRVEARLASGRGRVGDGRLSLDLSWELSGGLSVRTASRVEVLGREVELPSTWLPEAPVRGDARAKVDGWRDESRGR